MYDAFAVRGKKLEPDRACTVSTCGERSKCFIGDMMNLVLLFRWLNFLEISLSQKRLAPCCACTCSKRPKHGMKNMNFATRQCCGTCPPSKQNKTRFTCPTTNDGEHLSALITVKFSAKLLTTLEY